MTCGNCGRSVEIAHLQNRKVVCSICTLTVIVDAVLAVFKR